MQIFANTSYDFLRWRWYAITLSWLLIGAGVVLMALRGLPLGIDFSGGTSIVLEFKQDPPIDQIRQALASLPGDEVIQRFGDPSEHRVLVRLPQEEGAEEGASLEQASLRAESALRSAGLPEFEVVNRELVGPVIGADLQRRGIYATVTALVAISIYIAIRFRFSFGLGALVATFHDLLITVAFLLFFGYDISLNVVAALLTITGYSVNDTIVIFDRVRENMRSRRKESLSVVVNQSVNQTLARTVITSGTTFLAVLALFIFGGEALRGFSFTMLVGVVTGTYSTVFIASAIAIVFSDTKGRKFQTSTAPAEDAGTRQGQGRKQRRAKAS